MDTFLIYTNLRLLIALHTLLFSVVIHVIIYSMWASPQLMAVGFGKQQVSFEVKVQKPFQMCEIQRFVLSSPLAAFNDSAEMTLS